MKSAEYLYLLTHLVTAQVLEMSDECLQKKSIIIYLTTICDSFVFQYTYSKIIKISISFLYCGIVIEKLIPDKEIGWELLLKAHFIDIMKNTLHCQINIFNSVIDH